MTRKYRVITKDINESYTIMTDWLPKPECVKFIIGRWNHWPSFAYISAAKTDKTIKRVLGL